MKTLLQIGRLLVLLSLIGTPAWAMDCCCEETAPSQQCEMEEFGPAPALSLLACEIILPTVQEPAQDACLCWESSVPSPQALGGILAEQAFQPGVAALIVQATLPRAPRRRVTEQRIQPPQLRELPPKWAWSSFSLFPLPPPSQS